MQRAASATLPLFIMKMKTSQKMLKGHCAALSDVKRIPSYVNVIF